MYLRVLREGVGVDNLVRNDPSQLVAVEVVQLDDVVPGFVSKVPVNGEIQLMYMHHDNILHSPMSCASSSDIFSQSRLVSVASEHLISVSKIKLIPKHKSCGVGPFSSWVNNEQLSCNTCDLSEFNTISVAYPGCLNMPWFVTDSVPSMRHNSIPEMIYSTLHRLTRLYTYSYYEDNATTYSSDQLSINNPVLLRGINCLMFSASSTSDGLVDSVHGVEFMGVAFDRRISNKMVDNFISNLTIAIVGQIQSNGISLSHNNGAYYLNDGYECMHGESCSTTRRMCSLRGMMVKVHDIGRRSPPLSTRGLLLSDLLIGYGSSTSLFRRMSRHLGTLDDIRDNTNTIFHIQQHSDGIILDIDALALCLTKKCISSLFNPGGPIVLTLDVWTNNVIDISKMMMNHRHYASLRQGESSYWPHLLALAHHILALLPSLQSKLTRVIIRYRSNSSTTSNWMLPTVSVCSLHPMFLDYVSPVLSLCVKNDSASYRMVFSYLTSIFYQHILTTMNTKASTVCCAQQTANISRNARIMVSRNTTVTDYFHCYCNIL